MNELKKVNFNNMAFRNYKYEEKVMKDLSLNGVKPPSSNNEVVESRFNFIKAHGGLQVGHVHVLLGRTNKGKSAIILEIILDNAQQNIKTLLFLSEAKKDDIRIQVDNLLAVKKIDESLYDSIRDNIIIVTQSDLKGQYNESPRHWINALTAIARSLTCKVLIIDNISGIKYGNATPDEQVEFIQYLNDSTQRDNLVTFLAVHQAKSVDPSKELELHDVRANQNFTSIPSYVYAVNDFNNLTKEKRIIKILKSRNCGSAIGKYFELFFNSKKVIGFYEKDREISQQIAKNTFHNNLKLNKTSIKYS